MLYAPYLVTGQNREIVEGLAERIPDLMRDVLVLIERGAGP